MSGSTDTWLREYEEAVKLADDIMAKIQERNDILRDGGDPSRLVTSTRRKITVLVTKADRLETLLQNPSGRLNISEKEVQRRQDMLVGVRFRTKQMASALSTAQSSNRATLLGDQRSGAPSESSRTIGLDNRGILSFQSQIMREQDDEMVGLESTIISTKHIAMAVNEELTLQDGLLTEVGDGVDRASSNVKSAQRRLTAVTRNLGKDGGCLTFLLVAIILAVILVALLDILKYFH